MGLAVIGICIEKRGGFIVRLDLTIATCVAEIEPGNRKIVTAVASCIIIKSDHDLNVLAVHQLIE